MRPGAYSLIRYLLTPTSAQSAQRGALLSPSDARCLANISAYRRDRDITEYLP